MKTWPESSANEVWGSQMKWRMTGVAPDEDSYSYWDTILIAAVPLLLAAAKPKDTDIVLDGVASSQIVDAAYVMRCNEDTIRLAWRQTHLDPDDLPMREAMRATLTKLTVSRRQITRAGFTKADELFQSFAYVEKVEARCFRGEIYLWVRGTPLRAWLDIFRKGINPPRRTTASIDISRRGEVKTRPEI